MSQDNQNTQGNEQQADGQQSNEQEPNQQQGGEQLPGEQQGTEPQDDPNEGEPSGLDELPEWAREEIRKNRRESGRRRVQVRELEQKYEEAKSQAEKAALVDDLKNELAQTKREAQVAEALRQHGLDENFRVMLNGATQEEISMQAEVLASLRQGQSTPPPPPGPEPRGGFNPSGGGPEQDPVALLKQARSRR